MNTGTITFTSPSAAAIFDEELTGQFSDGMWENSRPYDHWKFWCNLKVAVGTENKVTTDCAWKCGKKNYNISSLFPIIGDRMLKIGKMAKACGFGVDRRVAEYMPDSFEEWKACKASGNWEYEWTKKDMEAVTEEQAAAYYATSYTMKDMKEDVKLIKAAMLSV